MTSKDTSSLKRAIEAHKDGAVLMVEHPASTYIDSTILAVKTLTDAGYEGVYISYQRPYKNISDRFKAEGIAVDSIAFIDAATALADQKNEKNPKCICLASDADIDDLVRAVYTSFEKLDGKGKFVYMDSLSTITLYKPLSEVVRFSEFMVRIVRKHEIHYAVFGVAEDFAQKNFVKNIALRVDEVLQGGNG
ncbi:MAG: hypothetical protein WC408_01430 [Candidatus Micrarchaeia archaeon]|jgi:KaiC/GvpD/RAD55 family RecA-like ATPase